MDNKDVKLNESELNSITGGGVDWVGHQREVCKGVTKLTGSCQPDYGRNDIHCRGMNWSADPKRDMGLFKYCNVINIFLE